MKFETGVGDTTKNADTIEETIAIRNNRLVNGNMQENDKQNSIAYGIPESIDVDNAKWHQDYASKMERNLERFKELGLYRQLQDIGIIYDEDQFKRNYVIARTTDGKQCLSNGDMDSYDDAERQFDESVKKNNSNDGKNG